MLAGLPAGIFHKGHLIQFPLCLFFKMNNEIIDTAANINGNERQKSYKPLTWGIPYPYFPDIAFGHFL